MQSSEGVRLSPDKRRNRPFELTSSITRLTRTYATIEIELQARWVSLWSDCSYGNELWFLCWLLHVAVVGEGEQQVEIRAKVCYWETRKRGSRANYALGCSIHVVLS